MYKGGLVHLLHSLVQDTSDSIKTKKLGDY